MIEPSIETLDMLTNSDMNLKLNCRLGDLTIEPTVKGQDLYLDSIKYTDIEVIAALSYAIYRLSGSKKPVFGIMNSLEEAIANSSFRLLPVDINKNLRVSEAKESIKKALKQPPLFYNSSTIKLLKDIGFDSNLSIGIIFKTKEKKLCYEYINSALPLNLYISQSNEGLLFIKCIYNTSFFSEKSIEVLLQSLKHLVTQINSEPNTKLFNLSLLDETEKQKVVKKGLCRNFINTEKRRVEDYFSMIAKNTPDKTALICSDRNITYLELDELSTKMAKSLVAFGVKPGDTIGICLDRSYKIITSILAILKAGGAYVPMDPAYPDERLEYTCKNSGINLVITDIEAFPHIAGIKSVEPDNLNNMSNSICLPNKAELKSNQTAYVIYTSGSTGRPKGVEVTHDNLLTLIMSAKGYFDLQSKDVWTFYHSAAFDYSVWEIWGCLLTGAKLIIIPYWVSRSPDEFYSIVVKNKVSILNQTPSSFLQFMKTEKKNEMNKNLRLILLGGEELDTEILKEWQKRYPLNKYRVENMYGITETTVISTSKKVTEEDILNGSRSIGKPLPGWYIYVLDSDLNLLPFDVPGEIYIGGEGVAKGYINQPELTNIRYIPDPFRKGLMYKSGDKGILLQNGEVEFLGRLDTQVKLRGCRIELDEIRKIILTIEEVQSAHVILNHTDKSDPASARLDSYIVLSKEISIDRIIDLIKKKLPTYMLPSSFTIIDKIPMTHNGKIDISALPKPSRQPLNRENQVAKSEDSEQTKEVETSSLEKIINVWKEVLGCEVAVDDNFFSLGGNSLYAVRIVNAMSEIGLPELSLRNLYTHQTIEKLLPHLNIEIRT